MSLLIIDCLYTYENDVPFESICLIALINALSSITLLHWWMKKKNSNHKIPFFEHVIIKNDQKVKISNKLLVLKPS